MYWLFGLLVVETVCEGFVCARPFKKQSLVRPGVLTLGFALTVLSLVLAIGCWQVWLWALLLAAYRIINLARIYTGRMPAPELRIVTLRAYGWLVAAQVVVTLAARITWHEHIAMDVLDVAIAAQLLCAIVLLRASTHTWRHAIVPPNLPSYSDKQLPSVSVLVPARNETDDLVRCLEALCTSNYPKLEILVLDDCSASRQTPDIIRSFAHSGIRFLQGTPPDEHHWLAKNHAYAQLAHEASGEILLFCGVDVLLGPDSLRNLVAVLLAKEKDMISVMPLRSGDSHHHSSLLQAMRYYWEMCLPRRLFKRPPVLSTCWLIRSAALQRLGGFESVSRSITPEAAFARRAVATDDYSFIRSNESLGIYSNKPENEQYSTSLRVRYPQLHRRLELVALVSAFELVFFIGPLIGLLLSPFLVHAMAYIAVWAVTLLCLFVTYGLVTVGAQLTNPWYGWLLMPLAFVVDLAVLHISLYKYEFSSVDWKGRNVCIPVMRLNSQVSRTTEQ